MPRARKLEEALAALRQLTDPTTEAAIATMRQTLAGKHGVAIAQASRLIRKAEIASLVPDLVSVSGNVTAGSTFS